MERVYTLEVETNWIDDEYGIVCRSETLEVFADSLEKATEVIRTSAEDNEYIDSVKITQVWKFENILKYLIKNRPDDLYNPEDFYAYAEGFED